jgi:undecaprenyl-diphosphatase
MTLLESIFLGALQGITEFLPISSSGHLVIAKHLLDLSEVPLLFDVLLHVATLCAVVLIFRRRLLSLLATLWRLVCRNKTEEDGENIQLLIAVSVATVCTAGIGLLLAKLNIRENTVLVSVLFIVTGLILLCTVFMKGEKDYHEIGLKEGIAVGISQGLGVLPGISRSGITISAALALGIKREKVGEFSFILSIPAILGALVLEAGNSGDLVSTVSPLLIVCGFAAAFFVGLISIILLLKLIRSKKIFVFSFYLIPLGILGWIFL